jgi:UDP-2,3-diacylglucosamine hydrolase
LIIVTSASTTIKRKSAEAGNGEILGLVAGDGKLPGILARNAHEKGYKVVALCLSEEAHARVESHCHKAYLVAPGQIGRNLKLLQDEFVKQIVFVGKVPKLDLLKNIAKLDWTAVRELSKLSDFSDDSIQRATGELLESKGITVRTQAEFLTELFPDIGVLTKRQPTAQEYADIAYGKRIAKEIARLDIGQTVVVREEMILAIEAIEGTDEAIRRAVELARNPVVVVKVAKPGQDQRFDIPTVGLNTLNSMCGPRPGGVLAVEANETMVVERDEMIEFAEKHNMCIVSV